MAPFAEFARAPRSALVVMLVLAFLEHQTESRGATYEGLRVLLGLRSSSAVRQAVRKAREFHLVEVVQTGSGGKAVIRISNRARKLISALEKRRGNGPEIS